MIFVSRPYRFEFKFVWARYKNHNHNNQRISNQSSLGLISPISPTSPGMDWVTITILKMDWNCNGSIWFFQTNPFQSNCVNFPFKLQLFSNFTWILKDESFEKTSYDWIQSKLCFYAVIKSKPFENSYISFL